MPHTLAPSHWINIRTVTIQPLVILLLPPIEMHPQQPPHDFRDRCHANQLRVHQICRFYFHSDGKPVRRDVVVEKRRSRGDVVRSGEIAPPGERGVLVALWRSQWNAMALAEADRENARRTNVVAEPVGARDLRRVVVNSDHDVAATEDAHDGCNAYGGEVERIDGFQLHSNAQARVYSVVWRADLKRREEFVGGVVVVVETVVDALQVFYGGYQVVPNLEMLTSYITALHLL